MLAGKLGLASVIYNSVASMVWREKSAAGEKNIVISKVDCEHG
jgi:hypothetical protein